ncbi:MAG: von Willebrand factor type A domain-containing protein [Gemmatimonadaceae bacterium]|nr:von Willebrand factor type A domain-containing protein [Gemmatimonadaceae bacterium]
MRVPRSPVRLRAILVLLALLSPTLGAHAPQRGGLRQTTTIVGRVSDPAGRPISGVSVTIAARTSAAATDADGRYALLVDRQLDIERIVVHFRRTGYANRDLPLAVRGDTVRLDAQLVPRSTLVDSTTVAGRTAPRDATVGAATIGKAPGGTATGGIVIRGSDARSERAGGYATQSTIAPGPSSIMMRAQVGMRERSLPRRRPYPVPADSGNTEAYEHIDENAFRSPLVAPLSTFSVDVDRASYANVRRFLTAGTLPPRDAVRIEELVNYFPYADDAPTGRDPLRITTEVAPAPWNPSHDLVRIGLRARDVDMRRAPASNLVFLVDVSGSMQGPHRLGLVKQSLALLVDELREQDRVAIVVYAGSAGLVLPSTSGGDKTRILAALDGLQAGGSTAGGAGIRLAYDVARQHFIRGGTNRVILCTDGDFNVGQSSDAELVRLIEEKRREGSFLTILGYGMGNYKDQKMEKLAGAGNGNYAYIDDLLEASKMLVKEMGGTLITVAKDVKLQVEFDPTRVQAYRLLGYEDRLLREEDFANDVKDAGDVGAGHAVTALYEIIRTEERLDVTLPPVSPLRYQRPTTEQRERGGELLHVALRYKSPDGERSVLRTHPVRERRLEFERPSESMRFASAVAGFGMLLRNSPHAGSLTWPQVVSLARGAVGTDPEGYRADFIRLAEIAASVSRGIARSPGGPTWNDREP